MTKWKIDYLTSEGEFKCYCVEALGKDEATEIARQNCWDIDTILNVHK